MRKMLFREEEKIVCYELVVNLNIEKLIVFIYKICNLIYLFL